MRYNLRSLFHAHGKWHFTVHSNKQLTDLLIVVYGCGPVSDPDHQSFALINCFRSLI